MLSLNEKSTHRPRDAPTSVASPAAARLSALAVKWVFMPPKPLSLHPPTFGGQENGKRRVGDHVCTSEIPDFGRGRSPGIGGRVFLLDRLLSIVWHLFSASKDVHGANEYIAAPESILAFQQLHFRLDTGCYTTCTAPPSDEPEWGCIWPL